MPVALQGNTPLSMSMLCCTDTAKAEELLAYGADAAAVDFQVSARPCPIHTARSIMDTECASSAVHFETWRCLNLV